ncbi:hypothetical protein [Nostoc sphaeroides]|nr:hypothetical protein [Nostoc sphaeroides]
MGYNITSRGVEAWQYPPVSTYSYFQLNRPRGRGTAMLIGVNLR